MIVLQKLQFPNPDTCSSFEMFFRPREGEHAAWMDPDLGALRLPRWTHLDLNTYFNSFSIGKWRKYTVLDNLRLRLELRGEVQVQLMHWEMIGNKCFRHMLAEKVCQAPERGTFDFEIPLSATERGIVCCGIYALDDACALYGGAYVTEADESRLNPVDIAIDICTFRREPFIERNVALINREIIGNPDSDLQGHLDVFIADNGATLDIPRLSNERIHIFPNKNTGGSGGFARGMMEIIDHPKAFSHVLVMDDDVLINTDALLRTYWLLRLLKPEYSGKTVAGAMLRLDNRWMQHECCAKWNGRMVEGGKTFLDLRKIKSVLKNEVEVPFDFNAWWYSCVPMSKISNDSLPLPLFIRMDDVEFGLRTGSDMISLNGICLWHEPFAYKFASSMEYYEIRNLMILNSIHRPDISWKQVGAQVLYRILANLSRYRYKDCELVLWGAKDFLAGPEALMRRDATELHQQVMAASDKFVPLKELDIPFDEAVYRRSFKRKKKKYSKWKLLFLNGLFLPPKPPTVVDAFLSPPWETYRRKALLNYNGLIERGFVTRRSVAKSLSYVFKGVGMCLKLRKNYARTAEAYRQSFGTLTSRAFWDEYLGLK